MQAPIDKDNIGEVTNCAAILLKAGGAEGLQAATSMLAAVRNSGLPEARRTALLVEAEILRYYPAWVEPKIPVPAERKGAKDKPATISGALPWWHYGPKRPKRPKRPEQKKTPGRFGRGQIAKEIQKLITARPEGIHIKEIATLLGRKASNIYVWWSCTGKKIPAFQIDKGVISLRP